MVGNSLSSGAFLLILSVAHGLKLQTAALRASGIILSESSNAASCLGHPPHSRATKHDFPNADAYRIYSEPNKPNASWRYKNLKVTLQIRFTLRIFKGPADLRKFCKSGTRCRRDSVKFSSLKVRTRHLIHLRIPLLARYQTEIQRPRF